MVAAEEVEPGIERPPLLGRVEDVVWVVRVGLAPLRAEVRDGHHRGDSAFATLLSDGSDLQYIQPANNLSMGGRLSR